MTLSGREIDHIALLARLGLSADEKQRLGAQLDAILEHISALQRIDTAEVPETAQVGTRINVWREDDPAACLPPEVALANAPDREGDHFRVGAIQ